jgi:hypothetical protein
MIHQEILKGLTLSVGKGGLSLTLEPEENKEKEGEECQDSTNVSSWADSDTIPV